MAQDGYNLIEMAAKGDRSAFETLVKKYDRKVISLALKYTRSEEDAKDIYQEVFLRVWKSLPGFGFKSEFSTWLFRIATNVCLSYIERAKKHRSEDVLESTAFDDEDDARPALQIESTDPGPLDNLGNSEIKMEIKKAVDELPAKQKLVFTMKYYEDYKIREISELTGLNEGTVKRYLFEATLKLKNALRPFYEQV